MTSGMSHPKHLRKLVAAYNANDLKSLTDGTAISSWANRKKQASDSSLPLVQATAVQQPTKVTDNGKPGVQFDGGDDYLSVVFPTALAQPCTIAIVLRVTAPPAVQFNVLDGIGAPRIVLFSPSAGNLTWSIYAGTALLNTTAPVTSAREQQIILVMDGANTRMYINKVLYLPGNPGTSGLDGLYLGYSTSIAPPMIVHELAIWSQALRKQDVSRLSHYLSRWGR